MRRCCPWQILGLAAGLATATTRGWPADRIALPELASPYQRYELPLRTLVQPPAAIGLLLKARINAGPPLRLLLDSGAEHLVLDRNAARRAGCAPGAELNLVGPAASTRPARTTSARSMTVGDLEFRNITALVVQGALIDGIDGAIPLSLFAGFLIQLDAAGKRLVLEPYPAAGRSGLGDFVQARAQHHLLFLRGSLEDRHDGYLLLDTGSSYNLISHTAAGALRKVSGLAPSVPLLAGVGATAGRLLPGSVTFRLGRGSVPLYPVVAMDLGEISRRSGFELAGVIGYPALAGSTLTVDYRELLVRIRPR